MSRRSAAMRGKPFRGPGAPKWRLGRFLRVTLAPFLRWLFKVRVTGVELIPEGGALLAGNHVSYLDPTLLWCVTPRPTHFLGKAELWEHRALGWFLDLVWVFPVHRGKADRQSISTARALLEADELVAMFPEGRRVRSDDDQQVEAYNGVAFIASGAGVPVVPIGIAGTDKAWPVGARFPKLVPVTMVVGEPVYPESFSGNRKERLSAMTAEVMRRIVVARQAAEEA